MTTHPAKARPAVRTKKRDPREGRGLFERVMFSFMGPPQLGDPDEPPSRAPHGHLR
jgi:hypothetical protein